MNNSKKINDKGFSLIELIVVIAIMVVLVAILSPVFPRFIEQGRRATDVTNANTIASAILIDIENGDYKNLTVDTTNNTAGEVKEGVFESIKNVPTPQGTGHTGSKYYFVYEPGKHVVHVTIMNYGYDLTDSVVAAAYKVNSSPVADKSKIYTEPAPAEADGN